MKFDIKKVVTPVATRVRETVLSEVTSARTLTFLALVAAKRSVFSMTISNDISNTTYDDLLDHILNNIVFQTSPSLALNGNPKNKDKIIQPDSGLYVFKLGGFPFLANINKMMVVMGTSTRSVKQIKVTGLLVGRSALEKFIQNTYDDDIFLPYVYKDGRVIGLIEERYATQDQFVKEETYTYLDTVIDRFVNNHKYYIDNQLPYKETVMLYGPPGTGKSTLARHFASKYKLDIYIDNPAAVANQTLPLIGKPNILLLEDIDAWGSILKQEFQSEGLKYDDYSEFINYLDGVIPLKNVLVIMTTNFRERLLESVVRPGRVDHSIFMDRFTTPEIIQRLGWETNDKRTKPIKQVDPDRINVAVLKALTLAKTYDEVKAVLEPPHN